MFSLIVLVLFIFFSISLVAFSMYTGISPMPSSRKAKKHILEIIPYSSKVIYELGSGWGTLALALGKAFPNAKILAYEVSILPWMYSLILKKLLNRKNVEIKRKNFFEVPLQQADAIVCYLYPGAMMRLKEKFTIELEKRCYVVSNCFSIPGWHPIEKREVKDLWGSKIFLYKIDKGN